MDSLDLIGHLANFLWPAAVTAAVAAGLAKWLWREELRHTRGWRLAAWAGAAGTAALGGGLALTGEDGRMATYAALVLAETAALAWAGWGWRAPAAPTASRPAPRGGAR